MAAPTGAPTSVQAPACSCHTMTECTTNAPRTVGRKCTNCTNCNIRHSAPRSAVAKVDHSESFWQAAASSSPADAQSCHSLAAPDMHQLQEKLHQKWSTAPTGAAVQVRAALAPKCPHCNLKCTKCKLEVSVNHATSSIYYTKWCHFTRLLYLSVHRMQRCTTMCTKCNSTVTPGKTKMCIKSWHYCRTCIPLSAPPEFE